MASSVKPDFILYDLACTKDVCFSPSVWQVRLMLNYKHIPYETTFLEFQEIQPKLRALGINPHKAGSRHEYTVPAIQHVPTNTYIMDSGPILQFIETTYPNPPVTLASKLGDEVTTQIAAISPAFRMSVVPREINILSPRSQEYFRQTREAATGHRLEDMLDSEREEEAWKAADDRLTRLNDLLQTNKADGPFIPGSKPSAIDFSLVGSLQFARVVEKIFQRFAKFPAIKEVYEACVPYVAKND